MNTSPYPREQWRNPATGATATWITGPACPVLHSLDASTVDICITSPPYFWQRAAAGRHAIGNEPTLAAYIERVCRVFDIADCPNP